MAGDPFNRLRDVVYRSAKRAAEEGALIYRLGTVLTASPLTVDVAGTPQDNDQAAFYMADRLRQGRTETISLSGTTDSGGTIEVTTATQTVKEPVLQPGDLVLLLTDDDQIFFILDKVVRL